MPETIAAAAAEAYACFSISAYRAAVAMTRSVVEATAKDRGYDSGVLRSKIDAMASAQLLRPSTAEMAHEIRYWGNNMAHGDFADPVSAEEAEGVLTLMDEILQEVYQAPARLAKVRALRQQSS